jgi:ABC-type bacteriocin/lantibiotic exporter with double-glycine peptidase domain
MRILFRVFGYTARYPWIAAATMFCAIVGTLMVAVFPAVTQQVIEVVLKQHHPEKLVPLIAMGFAAFFAQDLLNCLRILLNNHFEQRVIFDLRSDLYARIQMLPLPWFDNRATGDIMTRQDEDVTTEERVLIVGIEAGLVKVKVDALATNNCQSRVISNHTFNLVGTTFTSRCDSECHTTL